MRGATLFSCFCLISKGISIHAPHAGGDSGFHISIQPRGTFQSTPPMRGATGGLWIHRCKEKYFNPRPPCGGRLKPVVWISGVADFNPRPPCGGRPCPFSSRTSGNTFQSTPPMRGATFIQPPGSVKPSDFNPRPPCGGRPLLVIWMDLPHYFNPRPPCGGRPAA